MKKVLTNATENCHFCSHGKSLPILHGRVFIIATAKYILDVDVCNIASIILQRDKIKVEPKDLK